MLFVSPSNLLVAKQVEIKWKTASVGLVATTGITLSHMHSELGGLTPWSSVGKARLSVAGRGAGVLSETSRRRTVARSVMAYQSWRPLRSRADPPGYCRPHGRCCRTWGRRRRWRSAGSRMFLHKDGGSKFELFPKTLLSYSKGNSLSSWTWSRNGS